MPLRPFPAMMPRSCVKPKTLKCALSRPRNDLCSALSGVQIRVCERSLESWLPSPFHKRYAALKTFENEPGRVDEHGFLFLWPSLLSLSRSVCPSFSSLLYPQKLSARGSAPICRASKHSTSTSPSPTVSSASSVRSSSWSCSRTRVCASAPASSPRSSSGAGRSGSGSRGPKGQGGRRPTRRPRGGRGLRRRCRWRNQQKWWWENWWWARW